MLKHKAMYALPVAALVMGGGVLMSASAWADGTACTAEGTEASCTASTGEELLAGIANNNVSSITLTDNVNVTSNMVINHSLTIDGGGKTIDSTGTAGFLVKTESPVVINNLTLKVPAANSKAVQIYSCTDSTDSSTCLGTYDVTVSDSVLQSNGYGIIDYVEYYNPSATDGILNVVNSTIEWIDTSGNPVSNPETEMADLYSWGLVNYGMRGASWVISDSDIRGYRYVSQLSYDATGADLVIDRSYLAGRTAIDTFAQATSGDPFEILVSDSILHGINLYGGASEDYANVLLDYSNDSVYATNTNIVLNNVEFTVYENDTALNGLSAGQYAVSNRTADVDGSNNTVMVSGDSSYLVDSEYQAAKSQVAYPQTSNFQESWTEQYGITPATSGIVVYGGTYSYDPTEYVAEGLSVYLTEDGYVVVDDEELANQNFEYADDDGDGIYELMPIKVDWYQSDYPWFEDLYNDDYAVVISLTQELIADRLASFAAEEKTDLSGYQLVNGGELYKAIEMNLLARDGVTVIPVENNNLLVYIDISEEDYNKLAEYDSIAVVYFDEDGNEVERLDAELKGENGWYWIEFTTSHLSTYGIVGVNEAAAGEAAETTSPETGAATRGGVSAMGATIATAVAVGIVTSIVSFVVLTRKQR